MHIDPGDIDLEEGQIILALEVWKAIAVWCQGMCYSLQHKDSLSDTAYHLFVTLS